MWLLDSETLRIRRKIFLLTPQSVAVAPASSFAYVGDGDQSLLAVDLEKGAVVHQYDTSEFRQTMKRGADGTLITGPDEVGFLTLSDDGKTMFCVSSDALHRFRVSGAAVTYEDSSPRLGSNPQSVALSPDGDYVAMPDGGGNFVDIAGLVDDAPRVPYSTFVFSTSDLQKPILSLRSGAYPARLAFDKAGGNIYTESSKALLQVFNSQGVLQNAYTPLPTPNAARLPETSGLGDVIFILPHPRGKRVLVGTSNKIWWIELFGAPSN